MKMEWLFLFLPCLAKNEVKRAFGEINIKAYDNSSEMFSFIKKQNSRDPVFLFMSYGDYDGFNIKKLSEELPDIN